jgi:hypothetical protein
MESGRADRRSVHGSRGGKRRVRRAAAQRAARPPSRPHNFSLLPRLSWTVSPLFGTACAACEAAAHLALGQRLPVWQHQQRHLALRVERQVGRALHPLVTQQLGWLDVHLPLQTLLVDDEAVLRAKQCMGRGRSWSGAWLAASGRGASWLHRCPELCRTGSTRLGMPHRPGTCAAQLDTGTPNKVGLLGL